MTENTLQTIDSLNNRLSNLLDEGYTTEDETFDRNEYENIVSNLKSIRDSESGRRMNDLQRRQFDYLDEAISILDSFSSNSCRELDSLDAFYLLNKSTDNLL